MPTHDPSTCSAAVMAALLFAEVPVVAAAEELLEFEIEDRRAACSCSLPDAPGAGPRTLVVVFHGRGDDDRAFASAVRLHKDWPDAIVAYPRGEVREATTMRGWQYRVGEQGDRDLKLTDRLLEEMSTRYGTRPESTHVAGFSNGGHFTLLLMAAPGRLRDLHGDRLRQPTSPVEQRRSPCFTCWPGRGSAAQGGLGGHRAALARNPHEGRARSSWAAASCSTRSGGARSCLARTAPATSGRRRAMNG